jgi:hypothetical protein
LRVHDPEASRHRGHQTPGQPADPGHLKNEHRMIRNHLAGSQSDVAHAIFAAVGYNFQLLLRRSLFASHIAVTPGKGWLSATFANACQLSIEQFVLGANHCVGGGPAGG